VFPNSIEYWGPNGMVFFRNVQFRWMPNLAFGLGYQATNEQITVSNANPYGDMQFNVRGAELFVRASF